MVKQMISTIIVTILLIKKTADVIRMVINAKVKSTTPKVRAVTSTAINALNVRSRP